MTSTQPQSHRRRTARRSTAGVLVSVAAALFTLAAAGPVQARQDQGPDLVAHGHAGACLLERVGTQFTRCDDLTGNGVPAPASIPER